MEIKQVWMSQDTRKKSRYGLRTLGGVLGIAALVMLAAGGGTVLALSKGWFGKEVSLLLCLGAAALGIVLAAGLGRRAVRDTTVFFLAEGDRLFALDARRLVDQGRDLLSHAAAVWQTQQVLRRLVQNPRLPAGGEEIVQVHQIQEKGDHYVLHCRVYTARRRVLRRTYFLFRGMADQDALLSQLERRRKWTLHALEPAENRNPFRILLSALACCALSALCLLSHPEVGRLPQGIYFPCLGAAFAAGCCLVWFAVRQHRGE